MKQLRAIFRLFFFSFTTLWFMGIIVARSLVRGIDIRHALAVRKRWANFLLPRLGIQTTSIGTPPDFPCILMGNHRSYLDPILILLHVEAFPVSKAEVANWPIIGAGAKLTGIVFLQRESATSRKITLQAIAEKVKEGHPVILFPEGTTHALPATGEFKPGAFNLASRENIPVVPVAIQYGDAAAYWVGKATFLPHFMRYFGRKNNTVTLQYGPVITGTDTRTMLGATQQWIDEALHASQR